jgi:signal transduction histidine kinase
LTPEPPRLRARDRVIDLVGILVAVLVAAATAAEADASGRLTGDALFQSLVLACPASLALWWRRRHPVGVALLLAPVAALTDLVGAAVVIAVYTVAATRRRRVALAVAVVHVLASVPYAVLRPDPELTAAGSVAVSVVLLAVTVGFGTIARSRRRTLAALRERAVRAAAESELRAEQLRRLERERIAGEMHDALAHRISLVSLHAGALEIRPDLTREEVTKAAATIRAAAHHALEDLREILGLLRADGYGNLHPQPTLATVDTLVDECRAAGTEVTVDDRLPAGVRPPPSSASRTAYRVIQEGLTNARKHAPGVPVHVRLDRTGAGELHVLLRNRLVTGPGPAIPGARSGLVGLAERVSLAGGRLDHGARHGEPGVVAFHLEAWLPWPT